MFSEVAITLSWAMATHFPGCLLSSLSYLLMSSVLFSNKDLPLVEVMAGIL